MPTIRSLTGTFVLESHLRRNTAEILEVLDAVAAVAAADWHRLILVCLHSLHCVANRTPWVWHWTLCPDHNPERRWRHCCNSGISSNRMDVRISRWRLVRIRCVQPLAIESVEVVREILQIVGTSLSTDDRIPSISDWTLCLEHSSESCHGLSSNSDTDDSPWRTEVDRWNLSDIQCPVHHHRRR